MRVIKARSVNEAFHAGAMHLAVFGKESDSRVGPVLVSPTPVITVYDRPRNRVLLGPRRDANPFFHLFESLWMLAGRNDLEFPMTFVSTFGKFSDDGETLWGAYGHRWRNWFGFDQLLELTKALKDDPGTRRAVLQMWSACAVDEDGEVVQTDLERGATGGKDVPCNLSAVFDTLDGRLNMTVFCRSNDMVLGAYGANAVHFSILLEWVAAASGLPMGVYRQFSNNFHAYTQLYGDMFRGKEGLASLGEHVLSRDFYGTPGAMKTMTYDSPTIHPVRLIQDFENPLDFIHDCERFCEAVVEGHAWLPDNAYETLFFDNVVLPMYHTWKQWKERRFDVAVEEALTIKADDWRTAAQEWLETRQFNREKKGA